MTTAKCKNCKRTKDDHWPPYDICKSYSSNSMSQITTYEEDQTMSEKSEGLTPWEAYRELHEFKCVQQNNSHIYKGVADGGDIQIWCASAHEWRTTDYWGKLWGPMDRFRIVPDPSVKPEKDWKELLGEVIGQDNYKMLHVLEALEEEILREVRDGK